MQPKFKAQKVSEDIVIMSMRLLLFNLTFISEMYTFCVQTNTNKGFIEQCPDFGINLQLKGNSSQNFHFLVKHLPSNHLD